MNITTATNVRPCFANDTHVEMEETLPPSRPTVARSAMNMTTAPTSDIHPYFANHTQVEMEESLLPPRPVAARSVINMTTTPTNDILPRFTNDTHAKTNESLLPHRHDVAHSPINKTTTATNDGPRFHDNLVGKDVILFAILRSELAVARGTIISTNPNTMIKECKKKECKKASSTPLKGTTESVGQSLA
ncbi:uncharacterized protein [Miscanthus floridulus]|uniref:uncharacterized protein n=1 Tax=Miscanthus floridulus TaxID=154761 RepID=UPI003458D900